MSAIKLFGNSMSVTVLCLLLTAPVCVGDGVGLCQCRNQRRFLNTCCVGVLLVGDRWVSVVAENRILFKQIEI